MGFISSVPTLLARMGETTKNRLCINQLNEHTPLGFIKCSKISRDQATAPSQQATVIVDPNSICPLLIKYQKPDIFGMRNKLSVQLFKLFCQMGKAPDLSCTWIKGYFLFNKHVQIPQQSHPSQGIYLQRVWMKINHSHGSCVL